MSDPGASGLIVTGSDDSKAIKVNVPMAGTQVSVDKLTVDLGLKFMEKAASVKQDQIDFSKEVLKAREILDNAVDMVRPAMLDWIEESNKALQDIRLSRMAIVNEINAVKNSLADVRKFFLCDQHTEEMTRLKDFVEVCERLKALKDSGFLDSVADTILKLEK